MNYWICVIAVQQVSVVNFCDAWNAQCRGVHGPYTPWTAVYTAIYTVRAPPCTRTDHVHGPNTAVYTAVFTRSFMACTDRVHHDTMHTRHCKSWQQKFVGRLLLKSNHSFSPNRLVYVFGSRDLLGHNVGHVIAHAQLTLWTILLNLIERERVWEKRCGLWYACEVACGRGRSDVVSSRIYTYNHTYSLASYVGP